MKRLYLRRNGEVIECGDDFEIVNDRGMTMQYIRRLVDVAEPNVISYINIESCGRTPETMRMAFNKIAKERGISIKTFLIDDVIGFVICKPESVFI